MAGQNIFKIFKRGKVYNVAGLSAEKGFSTSGNAFKILPIKEHEEEYDDFIRKHFLPFEPSAIGLNATPDEMFPFIQGGMGEWIASGTSLKTVHESTNELAGINFNKILTRANQYTFRDLVPEGESEKVKITRALLTQLETSVDLFKEKDVEKVLEMALVAVDKKYSGNRLTQRMLTEAIQGAVNLGCTRAYCQASSIITQYILERVGFKPLYTLNYEDFFYQGQKMFDMEKMGDSKSAVVYFAEIPHGVKL